MDRSPAIIIHGLPDAQAAIARNPNAALRSAPGAVAYAGALWWRELVATLRASGWQGLALLDCGDQAAYAVEAIHAGVVHLIFDPSSPLFGEIVGLAVEAGGGVWEATSEGVREVVEGREVVKGRRSIFFEKKKQKTFLQ